MLKVDLKLPDNLFIVEVIKNCIGCVVIKSSDFNLNEENKRI